jgi:hypothetical protein
MIAASQYLNRPLRRLSQVLNARAVPRREPHRMAPQPEKKLNWRLIAVHVGNTTASAGGVFNGR